MSLKEILCQDKAISILQRAFASGRAPHAYIFAGRDGVGKFKTAREWAKMLLCKTPVAEDGFADSCGSCESCRLFEADSHPDFNPVYKELIQFTKDGKDRKTPVELPIDVIREFLIQKVPTRPTFSERKVFVVAEAQKLNPASQNALLKVLEEPPDYCTIILLCTRLERLLRATKSRCQTIRFGSVDEETIIRSLRQMNLNQERARYWARLAQGSLGQAWQWARLELAGARLYDTKNCLLDSLSTCKYPAALDLAEWLLAEAKRIAAVWAELDKAASKADISRSAQKAFVQIVISALSDTIKLTLEDADSIINFDQQEQISTLAGRFYPEQAAEKIAACYGTLREIESNVNEKLVFERLLLQLAVSDTMKV